MVFGAAVGGPGPTSLAYRRTLQRLSPWCRASPSSYTYSTIRIASHRDPRCNWVNAAVRSPPGKSSWISRGYSTVGDADADYLFPDFDSPSEVSISPSPSKAHRPPKASWKKSKLLSAPADPPDGSESGVALKNAYPKRSSPGSRRARSNPTTLSDAAVARATASPQDPPAASTGETVLNPSNEWVFELSPTPGAAPSSNDLDNGPEVTLAPSPLSAESHTAHASPEQPVSQIDPLSLDSPSGEDVSFATRNSGVSSLPTNIETSKPSILLKTSVAGISASPPLLSDTKMLEIDPQPAPAQAPIKPWSWLHPRPDGFMDPSYDPQNKYGQPSYRQSRSTRPRKVYPSKSNTIAMKRLIGTVSPQALNDKRLSQQQLGKVIDAFWQTWDPEKAEQVTALTWHRISLSIKLACSTEEGQRAIVRMATTKVYRYGLLRDMAIEAAVRDRWEGLFYVAVAFLAQGNPKEVGEIWQRYQSTIFEVQGKDSADLKSWDREIRLNARPVGEGIRPMNRVFVAARTVQGPMPAEDVRTLASDLRGQKGEFNLRWTEIPIMKALQKYPNNAELHAKSERNWRDVQTAGMFEHNQAAAIAIRSSALTRPQALIDLYHWILDKASGPDPLLRVVPWHQTMVSFEAQHGAAGFLLARKIWNALTRAFITNGQFACLVKLWTQDMPAFQIHPAPNAIGDIVLKLQSYMRLPHRPLHLVNECQKALTALIQLHRDRRDGSMIGDDAVRAAGLQDMEPAELDDFVARATLNRGRECGDRTRTELIMQLIYYKMYEQALEVLAWPTPRETYADEYGDVGLGGRRSEPRYWTSFVRAATKKYDRDPASADRLLSAAMKLAPPAGQRSMHLEAAIASHHLLMGRDIDSSLTPVFQALHRTAGAAAWSQAMAIIMTQQTGKSTRVNSNLADAAFRLIERFIRDPPPVFTEHAACSLLADYVLRMCTAAQMASSEQRMTFILRALTLARTSFKTSLRQFMWTLAIRDILLRNDQHSQQEAMQVWTDLANGMSSAVKMGVLYNELPLSDPQCRKFLRSVVISTFRRSRMTVGSSHFWNDARTKAILSNAGLIDTPHGSRRVRTSGKDASAVDQLLDPGGSYTDSDVDSVVDIDPALLPTFADTPDEIYGELLDEDSTAGTKARASKGPAVSSAPLVAPVLSPVGLASVPKTAGLRH